MLTINFMEGFHNDDVKLKVDDKEVFSGKLTTRLQIGMADKVEVDTDKKKVRIKIDVKNKDLHKTKQIDIDKFSHAAISIDNDEISISLSNEPFRFM